MSDTPTPPLPEVPSSEGAALLLEAKVNSLDILFSRNPRTYTEAEMKIIVAELRLARTRWDAAEAAGKTRAPKAPAVPKPGAKPKFDVGEIEL